MIHNRCFGHLSLVIALTIFLSSGGSLAQITPAEGATESSPTIGEQAPVSDPAERDADVEAVVANDELEDPAPPPPPSVRFDGVYRAELSGDVWSYLRFFKGASVISFVSTSTPQEVLRRFNEDSAPRISRGRYEIAGDRVVFSVTLGLGIVDYHGSIDGESLVLNSHSRINDHRSKHTYRFVQVSLGNEEALWLSVKAGDLETVRELLARNADPNARASGETLLHSAAAMGSADVVRELVRAGADLEARDRVQGTPLIRAALAGRVDTVRELVQLGADLEATSDQGVTALYWAVFSGRSAVVRELLEVGALVTPQVHGAAMEEPVMRQILAEQSTKVDAGAASTAGAAGPKEAIRVFLDVGAGAKPVDALDAVVDWTAIARQIATAKPEFQGLPPEAAAVLVKAYVKQRLIKKPPPAFTPEQRETMMMVVMLLMKVEIDGAEATVRFVNKPGEFRLAKSDGGTWRITRMAGLTEDEEDRTSTADGAAGPGRAASEPQVPRGEDTSGTEAGARDALPPGSREVGPTAQPAVLGAEVQAAHREQDLLWAAKCGDTEKVGRLLTAGIDPNAKNRHGETGLVLAAGEGQAEVVRQLLTAGADAAARSRMGSTALGSAMIQGHLEVVEALIDESPDLSPALETAALLRPEYIPKLIAAGADVNLQNEKGDSALTRLQGYSSAKAKEAVEILLAAGARVTPEHALILAARSGALVWVKALVESGAQVNAADQHGKTALMRAAEARRPSAEGKQTRLGLVRELLRAGADPKLQDREGRTAIMLAAEARFLEMVEALEEAGSALPAEDALRLAAARGDVEAVRSWVDKGVDLDGQDWRGRTALHVAAGRNHPEAVEALLVAGANPNVADSDGRTPLQFAVFAGRVRIVEPLLAAGADPNRVDAEGRTSLLWAADRSSQFPALVRTLVEAGAQVDVRTAWGETPLHLAARRGHEQYIEVLLTAGAHPNTRNKIDQTPLWLAVRSGKGEAVRAIERAGGDFATEGARLRAAALVGNVELARRLLAGNVSPDARPWQDPALWLAAWQGHTEIVRELVRAGADVEARGESCSTPLTSAAFFGHLEVVRELIRAGADLEGEDRGLTALDRAVERKQHAVVRELLAAGAIVPPRAKEWAKDPTIHQLLLKSQDSSNHADEIPPGGEAGKREDSPRRSWEVGQKALVNWSQDPYWYPATVSRKDGERYFVRFDDGDEEWTVASRMMVEDIEVGDRVLANRQGRGLYYPGVVTRREGAAIRIEYDDGNEETTTISVVRVVRPKLTLETLRTSTACQVEPGVFHEKWVGRALYIFETTQDCRWKGVFLADAARGADSEITVAEWGEVRGGGRQSEDRVLYLENAVQHRVNSYDPTEYSISRFAVLRRVVNGLPNSHVRALQSPGEQLKRGGRWAFSRSPDGRANFIHSWHHIDLYAKRFERLQVLQFDTDFRLVRRLVAATARFDESLDNGEGRWVAYQGWQRSFVSGKQHEFSKFDGPVEMDLPISSALSVFFAPVAIPTAEMSDLDAADVREIQVAADGVIQFNGTPITIQNLLSELREIKRTGGGVKYYRAGGSTPTKAAEVTSARVLFMLEFEGVRYQAIPHLPEEAPDSDER